MPEIILPDGSRKSFPEPVTVREVAADIGPGLAKAALAGEFNGKLVDVDFRIEDDGNLRIITPRDEEGVEVIRHSTAHLMAQAVKRLYPETQVTIGPTIEHGFYYDFAREEAFHPEDLEAIEKEMQRIVDEDLPVQRSELPRDEAISFFRDQGEEYKAEIIADIPAGETLSLYRQGDFIDLCRGPHVPSTGKLGAFKLTKLAGAYWRGNSDNEMLQRIYGTAWGDKKQLKQYLKRLEEAEKRDHRRIGKQLGLFHTQAEAPGMVFWHDHGWRIYRLVQDYIRERLQAADYQEVHTPEVLDLSLWQKSGHWENFKDNMFITSSEDRSFAIKPMNCPCHVQIFNQGLRSYRDLPLRMAEFGSCHRNEPSGSLHGLMRVRNFVQDDAHIFCTPAQMGDEVRSFNALVFDVYRDFGFEDIQVKLSTRPEQRVGSDEVWDRAEAALKDALESRDIEYQIQPGEGAFYGPKIEFSLTDCIGRVWQCGTMQVDFSMPDRLGAAYVDEQGEKQVPVMLHRAILGSVERFIGVLIEHYAGNLPVWLAPVQVQVLNITDDQAEYAESVAHRLQKLGFRAECDLRNEKIGFKIREQTLAKVPYLLVVGDREKEDGTVAVRQRDGADLGTMRLEAFADRLGQWEARRGRTRPGD
ncbi:MAG: threonine--tRNA ligase [Wenzhouxiangellaceae bacterium]|nr:threonine--tRNA ligase [Wenzhouxiangellaceae bacterium]MBS3822580.1 threonine--tRNA ligase [Wenzhouxiangellaceae bacterium]